MQVEQALQSAQEQVAKQLCPWAILSVWGYTDQPMPWLGCPPSSGLVTEKANDYSIVVLPDMQYILFVASSSGDTFQTV